MTEEEFLQAARRVSRYGTLLMWLVGNVVMAACSLIALWACPVIEDFGDFLRSHLRDEAAVGAIGGLTIGIALAPVMVVPVLPFLWLDRRFGLKCRSCGRSVTARCRPRDVLRSGRCCRCRAVLFERKGDSPV